MSSGGKVPEYTMLTPLPLTPDVMPHEYEHLVSLGVTQLPCDLVPHFSLINMVPHMAVNSTSHADELSSSDYLPPPPRLSPGMDEDREDDDDDLDEDERGDSDHRQNDGGEGSREGTKDPFAPHCKIPLPTPFSPYAYWLEPSFIRRRNERERQRVRNVNDGFERLKNHLPITAKDKDKRLSKVEILRMAIKYIRSLQDVLKEDSMDDDSKENMISRDSD